MQFNLPFFVFSIFHQNHFVLCDNYDNHLFNDVDVEIEEYYWGWKRMKMKKMSENAVKWKWWKVKNDESKRNINNMEKCDSFARKMHDRNTE